LFTLRGGRGGAEHVLGGELTGGSVGTGTC
jgi:hypothetical protein